jgi:molecular chaperone DnaK (HSP70)/HEAT repeat protein
MGYNLAIDFGTSNSVVARQEGVADTVEIVAIPSISSVPRKGERPLIPSLLYLHDGRGPRVSIGQAVRDQKLDLQRDNRLFRDFKRGVVSGLVPEPRLVDGVPWTGHDAGRHFLRELVDAIPFSSDELQQLVITAPVAAFGGYLTWLQEAVKELPAQQVRVVDESTAAALGYAVTEPGALVLVCDLGAGSLDLSLVQLPESRERTGGILRNLLGMDARQQAARVIAKAGLMMGGSDVDQWVLAEVLKRANLPARSVGEGYSQLLNACEQAKIALSTVDETEIAFQVDQGEPRRLMLQRVELEVLMEQNGFYTALRQTVDRVMSAAHRRNIYREDIKHVLLVGGTSLIPSVQGTLSQAFRGHELCVDKPFTAVAEGALQVAAGLGVDDRLTHSYGLRYLDPGTGEHRYDEIIPMGSSYPTKKPTEVILGAAHPAQEKIEFVIGQIVSEPDSKVKVEYETGQAVFVAQARQDVGQVQEIDVLGSEPVLIHLDPTGVPGEDRLRAEFTVDEKRQLWLTVSDLQTKKKQLENVLVASLEKNEADRTQEVKITGCEPRLAARHPSGQRRLSLRGLATMLNLLPPEAISLEAVSEALHSADFYVRYSAAEMLGRRGDRAARRIMQEVLSQGTAPVRASVARQLYRLSWYAAEPLVRQAFQDVDERVRASVVYGLCRLRGKHAYQLMQEVLPGESDAVLAAAAWGLADSPEVGAIPILELAMQAQDPGIRQRALESLGATRALEAIPPVRQGLEDPDLETRYAATLSLVELAREACLQELAGLIRRTRGRARQQILRGLFHATNYLHIDVASSSDAETVIDALEVALADEIPDVRVAAAMQLAWMRHERATATLQAGYDRERESETKARILYVGVNLNSEASGPLLQDALESKEAQVRETAEYLRRRGSSGVLAV